MSVKMKDVKVGDKLLADGGFPCIKEGTILEVMEDEDGLYVVCDGDSEEPELTNHYLDGQLGDDVEYIGFTKVA